MSHPQATVDGRHELPLIEPLSHQTTLLDSSEPFDLDAFLLSRASHNSLPELRTELRDYLASLKSELVQLINDDYASFISLSTDLRGEGARLEHVKFPLENIHTQIQASRDDLQAIQNNVQIMLNERIAVREEKALLLLLLKLSESITRMESLLYISNASSPKDDTGVSSGAQEIAPNSRSKGLSRLVSEFSHLDYLMQKVDSEECRLAEVFRPRVDRIKGTLAHDISAHFSSILRRKPLGEVDRTRKLTDIEQCLKYYMALGLCAEGERIMRQEVMQDFVKKNIFPNALNAPPSPIVPQTPLLPKLTHRFPPNTPFTPFQLPTSTPSPALSVALLNEDGGHLAVFYNGILRFVDREFRGILITCERLSSSFANPRSEHRFEVLANVIWEELGRAIIDELGNSIYAMGKPDEFQRNYIASQEFLSSLESISTTTEAVMTFRNHRTYKEFEKKWQLPIYFQLRWKSIVGPLDEALLDPISKKNQGETLLYGNVKTSFTAAQTSAAYHALRQCWASDVYITPLAWRFWRLTLQILLRYHAWLTDNTPKLEVTIKPSPGHDPRPNGSELTVDLAQEDSFLKQAATVLHDTVQLYQAVEDLWEQQISVLLPNVESLAAVKEALLVALNKISSSAESIRSATVNILSRRACDALQPLRHVLSQFRTMPTKRTPSRPSDFIFTVMKPVHVFFGDDSWSNSSAAFQTRYLTDWGGMVFDNVVARFISMLATMRQNEASLRRLKRGKKSNFSIFGSATSSVASSDDNPDEERMKVQLLLDISALGEDAKSLGIDIENHENFRRLHELASTRYEEN